MTSKPSQMSLGKVSHTCETPRWSLQTPPPVATSNSPRHEAVQDGGGHGGIAQVTAPVLHHSVGGDHDGTAQLVTLVHDGLQDLCGVLTDAPRQVERNDWCCGGEPVGNGWHVAQVRQRMPDSWGDADQQGGRWRVRCARWVSVASRPLL